MQKHSRGRAECPMRHLSGLQSNVLCFLQPHSAASVQAIKGGESECKQDCVLVGKSERGRMQKS